MELDHGRCFSAYHSRDARFDGRFFVGVRTTRIYCRPICPAPRPRAHNVRFFGCAAAAEEAGFRPCRRCRPDTAPGTPAWAGTSATVARALRLIEAGALDQTGVEALAARLGVGERHLRRLFLRHVGAAPLAVARTRRAHFARRLIDETRLPMIEVAGAAGFGSVRQFNDAIRATFGRTPTQLRARGPRGAAGDDISLRLPFRPPLDWRGLMRYLAPRAIPGVETVAGAIYSRSLALATSQGVITVEPDGDGRHLKLRARLTSPAVLHDVVTRVRRVFDLDADPLTIVRWLRRDNRLRHAARLTAGLRVPGAWDGFELAVRAVLGQQVSVAAATTLAGRLVQAYGRRLTHDGSPEVSHLFPEPRTLADADLEGLGLTARRREAVRAVARAVCDGQVRLEPHADVETTLVRLQGLPGWGAWTARYVALRALGEPDAFPSSDLGLRRALAPAGRPASARDVEAWSQPWRPWRAYAAVALWTSQKGKT